MLGYNQIMFPPASSKVGRRRAISVLLAGFATIFAPVRVFAEVCRRLVGADAGPFYPVEPIPYTDDLLKGASGRGLGAPVLYFVGRVIDEECRPVAGAEVELWQCDANGRYKHPNAPKHPPLNERFLYFAKVASAADGAFKFRTIRPTSYEVFGIKRAAHLHVRVRAGGRAVLTTEVYFAGQEDDRLRATDRVFQGRGARRGEMVVALQAAARFPTRLGVGADAGALVCEYDIALEGRQSGAQSGATAFAGRWSARTVMQGQDRNFELTLVVSDESISGTMWVDHAGELEIQHARYENGALLFDVPSMDPSMPMTFVTRLKDANTIAGTIDSPMGQLTFTGQRKK